VLVMALLAMSLCVWRDCRHVSRPGSVMGKCLLAAHVSVPGISILLMLIWSMRAAERHVFSLERRKIYEMRKSLSQREKKEEKEEEEGGKKKLTRQNCGEGSACEMGVEALCLCYGDRLTCWSSWLGVCGQGEPGEQKLKLEEKNCGI